MNKTPHKWQKEIIAWANGEQIQYRTIKQTDDRSNIWLDELEDNNPRWNSPLYEFRVKPKERVFKCRLALMKKSNGEYYTFSVDESNGKLDHFFISQFFVNGKQVFTHGENNSEVGDKFVRWATDIIYVRVEENE
jgi:hypothetical protein